MAMSSLRSNYRFLPGITKPLEKHDNTSSHFSGEDEKSCVVDVRFVILI